MIKSKTAVLLKQKNIKNLDLILQKPGENQLLVKNIYSGLCHTQLNEIDGKLGIDKYLPHCFGHEGIAKVVEAGKNVKKIKKNDLICVSWVKNSNKDGGGAVYINKKNAKKINAGPANTFGEYSIISQNRAYTLSKKNKYLLESVVLGCAIPTAFNAIFNVIKPKKKDKILIIGMGGLGLSCLIGLNHLKCEKIYCLDNNKSKLLFNKHIKSIPIFFKNKKEEKKFLNNNLDTFDHVINCTGSSHIISNYLSLVKSLGGKFVMIGNTKKNHVSKIRSWDIIMGKNLCGAWMSREPFDNNFKKFEKIFLKNIKIIKKTLKLKIYNLKNINQAINDFRDGKIIRAVIKY